MTRQRLPEAVRRLGGISLLTDVSSEMIYPLLPSFVIGTLHGGPALLGLIEGVAEATASVMKIVSGRLTDRIGRAKPLVVAGYTLSTLARPCMALALSPVHVLLVRFADRIGKGIRTAPRDALLAASVGAETRGQAFGFHRAMDNAGALLGPLVAGAALAAGLSLRAVFSLALVPGLLSLWLLVAGVRDAPLTGTTGGPSEAPRGPLLRYLGVLALFTLGNSSDGFLLLRAQQLGVSLTAVPLLWALHHLVKVSLGTPLGALSDSIGRRATIACGWAVYAICYLGFAAASAAAHVWFWFAAYGVFHAATEGAERALVADLVPEGARGRAFGYFNAVTGATLLPASLLTGALWESCGAPVALGLGAALAGLAALLLPVAVPERR